jgi:flagellar hook-basal body complex protein FliE
VSLAIDNSLTLANSGGIERADRMDRMDRALDNSGVGEATEFKSELGKAIGEIDKLQTAADTQADAVARGAGNIHEMALAMDKADVAMRLAMRVRNKLVDTYNDIMKMGI